MTPLQPQARHNQLLYSRITVVKNYDKNEMFLDLHGGVFCRDELFDNVDLHAHQIPKQFATTLHTNPITYKYFSLFTKSNNKVFATKTLSTGITNYTTVQTPEPFYIQPF